MFHQPAKAMASSIDSITQYVAYAVRRYGLTHIIEAFDVCVRAHAACEFNGPMGFGMQCWENTLNRFRELGRQDDTPFELVNVDGTQWRPALHHEEHGRIVVDVHRVKRPDLVPTGAMLAKRHAVLTGYYDLFEEIITTKHRRLVGIIGDEYAGLQEVVVGTLSRTSPQHEKYMLTDYITIYSAGERGNYGFDGDDGPDGGDTPPEPEVTPTVSVVRRDDSKRKDRVG